MEHRDRAEIKIIWRGPSKEPMMTDWQWRWDWNYITRLEESEPMSNFANSSGDKSFKTS